MNNQRQHPEDDALLSAYVDGELTAGETADVEARLASDPHAQQVVDQLRRLKSMTAMMRIKEPPPEEWEVFWQGYYNRIERSVGWVLLVLGGLALLGWVAYSLLVMIWHSENLPAGVRWGTMGAISGLVVLLVSVVRERLHKRKLTRYKDVVR